MEHYNPEALHRNIFSMDFYESESGKRAMACCRRHLKQGTKKKKKSNLKVFMETMRTEFEGCEQSKRRFLPHVHWPIFSTYDLGKRAAFISDEHLLVGATLHSPRTCRFLK